MVGYIMGFLVGVLCIVLGILNMKGNIASVHSYHRHRISEENKAPFGKKIGLGTVIIGGSLSLFGICSLITYFSKIAVFQLIGVFAVVIGVLVGFGLSIYAIIKYNKGIF